MGRQPDITSSMTDNETWNTCPICLGNWKELIPIPGLIHRTKLCKKCAAEEQAVEEKRKKKP